MGWNEPSYQNIVKKILELILHLHKADNLSSNLIILVVAGSVLASMI